MICSVKKTCKEPFFLLLLRTVKKRREEKKREERNGQQCTLSLNGILTVDFKRDSTVNPSCPLSSSPNSQPCQPFRAKLRQSLRVKPLPLLNLRSPSLDTIPPSPNPHAHTYPIHPLRPF